MTDHERPPVSGSEGARVTEVSPSTPSSVRSVKTMLKDLIDSNKELQTIQAEYTKSGYIKDEDVQKKVRFIRDNLRTIVADIQKPSTSLDKIVLPNSVYKIVRDTVRVSDIRNETAPVIYELLRISRPVADGGMDFNTRGGMKSALDAMVSVSHFEPHTAKKIIKELLVEAKAKGCTVDDMENANKFVDPMKYVKTAKSIAARREEWADRYKIATGPVDAISLDDTGQRKIRATQRAAASEALLSGRMSEEQLEQIIKDKITVEEENFRGKIRMSLNDVVSANGSGSQSEKASAIAKYTTTLSSLRSQGMISSADLSNLLKIPEDASLMSLIEDQAKNMQGDDLVRRAMDIIVPNEKQVELIRSISSAHSLKEFLQKDDRYMIGGADGTINWNAYMKDVKGIFSELLSIADRNPQQFFEQAFNPMFEGHFYQLLLQRINHLGLEVANAAAEGDEEGKWFAKQDEIPIPGQIETPSQTTSEPPYRIQVREKTTHEPLSTAILYLESNMNEYRHVREHLHNISAISTQGLGWEQLKQYAERLGLDKLDRLVRQEEDLSLAANFYSAALQQEVAVNGKVIMSSFGLGDEIYQLNSAERIAFFQMKAHMKAKPDNVGLNDAELNKQAMQKVRMAAAISYGLTGEFWNIMMTARMPMETKKAINASGEDINIISPSYIGTNHRGYEKMIGELDLDMVLQRFALPKLYNDLRYTPRYRDLFHPPSVLSQNGYFEHGIASKLRNLNEDAIVNGRSNELISLDEQYVCFMDFMRTKCVGLFARGGWRFVNADVCKEYIGGDPKRLDYIKTLANVRKMGSYITKRFIDELKPDDIGKMTQAEVAAYTGINRPGSSLTDAEKKLFKDKFYEKILFTQLGHTLPTKFLQIEDKRWTPRGEKLLRQHLCDYLSEQFGNTYPKGFLNLHVYNMYVSALTLAEKSTWEERKKDNQDYIFGSLDIDHHQTELESFFEQYKQFLGKHDEGGPEIKILEDKGDFIRILKGFQSRLQTSIDLPRHHNENGTGAVESLQKRFAEMLSTKTGDSKGNIENLIAGDDFNMENFYFNAGGGFGVVRMAGETFNITSKMNPALQNIINEALPDIVKGEYKDIHEFEKAIREKLVKPFKEIHNAISQMDKAQADEYCVSLVLFVANMIGKDRIMRIKGIGPVIDWSRRNRNGSQSSMFTDFFPNTATRHTHACDSDEIHAMGHIILSALNLPFSERIPDHVETHSILGRPISTRTVYKDEIKPEYETKKLLGFIPYKSKKHREEDYQKMHAEIFEKAAGIHGVTKWLENYLPMGAGIIFLIMIAMAYLASQKNKKK